MQDTWSPMLKTFEGQKTFTYSELLALSLQQIDNNVCDILFERCGSPRKVKKYIRNIDKVLINNESVKIDSPEVAALRKEAEKLKEENEIIKSNINKAVDDRINEVLSKYGF